MEVNETDLKLTVVKEKLNTLKIKLWLPPFYVDGQESSAELRALAERFCKELSGITEDDMVRYLLALQEKSLENLKEREEFKSTGLATLKIRPPTHCKPPFTLKIHLSSNGKCLRELICKEVNTPCERIKMIFKGKILTDDSLESQNVKHGTQIMVLIITLKTNEVDQFLDNSQQIDSTINDVNALTGKKNVEGEAYLEITDQSGKVLKLPSAERKALLLAMTLHEKGRSAIKSENFDLALLLLLEAEKSFSQCNSKLLEQVDNYGLLSMDLAWAYLNLQSISQLTDAQERLNRCDQIFKKSYGAKLERLVALKGSAGNEAALFLRFHLLQAIVYYHQGKTEQAKKLLDKVEKELGDLKVDDSKLGQLVELGYKQGESRIALREAKNNIDSAVTIIKNKIAERKRNRDLEKIEIELNKKRKILGKCVDGNWVEPQFHESLMEMGYSSNTARWALGQTSNRIADAVTLIQEHPDQVPSDDAISQIVSLGFDVRTASDTLVKHNGCVEKAVEELNTKKVANEASPSCSKVDKKKEKEMTEEAYNRVAEGITNEEEDYLDLTLTAEEKFLKQYQQLLSKQ